MYWILRNILRLSMLLLGYVAVVLVWCVPYAWIVAVIIVIANLCQRNVRLTAHGTRRWADVNDVGHMLEGNGIITGHIAGKPTKLDAVNGLFHSWLSAKVACQRFLIAFQGKLGKQAKQIVRLTNAVHTAVFAPTGAGKNVSIVEPFLFTSRESCVVIDIKGENARLTAAHREKVFKQKIFIIDPFKAVTNNPCAWNVLEAIDPADPEC